MNSNFPPAEIDPKRTSALTLLLKGALCTNPSADYQTRSYKGCTGAGVRLSRHVNPSPSLCRRRFEPAGNCARGHPFDPGHSRNRKTVDTHLDDFIEQRPGFAQLKMGCSVGGREGSAALIAAVVGVWTAARSCSAVLHTCLMAESDSELQVGSRVATPLGEVNNTSLEKHQAHTMRVRHSTRACPSIAERNWESKSPKRAKTITGRSLRIFRWPPTCSKPGPKKPSPSRTSTTR